MDGGPVLNDYPFGRQVKRIVLVLPLCLVIVQLINFFHPFLPWHQWTPTAYSGQALWPEAGRPPALYYNDFKVLFETECSLDKLPRPRREVPRPRRVPLVGHDKSRDCEGISGSFGDLSSKLDVYAVYWDTRHDNYLDYDVHLRIMTLTYDPSPDDNTEVFCVFNAETGSANRHRVKARYGFGGRDYASAVQGGQILSCTVPPAIYGSNRQRAPCTVRLAVFINIFKGAHLYSEGDFEILKTAPATQNRGFGVCVPPLYGDVPKTHIIEFIELTELLGSRHVTFYDYALSSRARSVIQLYVKLKRATLLPWKIQKDVDEALWRRSVKLAMADCLYRNMATSVYVAFMDLNEYIMPYKWFTWHDMMLAMRSEKISGISVSGVFFDPFFQKESDGLLHDVERRALTNRWRTVTSSRRQARAIVKPQAIFDTGASGHEYLFASMPSKIKSVDYPDALAHQHQVCSVDADMNCVSMVRDDVVSQRYNDTLETFITEMLQVFSKCEEDL